MDLPDANQRLAVAEHDPSIFSKKWGQRSNVHRVDQREEAERLGTRCCTHRDPLSQGAAWQPRYVIHHVTRKMVMRWNAYQGPDGLASERAGPGPVKRRPLASAATHQGTGGKELWKFKCTWMCSSAAVSGASSSSGSGSKNRRRTNAT